ncbi:MBL fold metallo-hydrolase [Oceanobacillus sp. 1P07AA]|uniref:MBL fold metallo-hydrolase n=1 Tax=Oceanobacillus sp. 1P07AA TaxID=3132293 RepID=UPI0039A447AB
MLEIYDKENITCVEMTAPKMSKVFIFLVDGMLVDTGPQRFESELIDFYKNITFDSVVLTHNHEDHTGTAPWIQDHLNVPIYLHSKGIELCSDDTPYPKYRQLTWGVRRPFKPIAVKDMVQSQKKEWEVIYTPGHANDHICLLDKQSGTLFSGDLFVSSKTKVIMKDESIPQIMNSIRTILSYDIRSIFCCHAGYVPNGKEKLKQKLDYLENLYGEIKFLYEKGSSIEEIHSKLFPKNYSIIAVSNGEWDSMHIVTSIVNDLR